MTRVALMIVKEACTPPQLNDTLLGFGSVRPTQVASNASSTAARPKLVRRVRIKAKRPMRIRKDGEAQASRDFAALRDSKKNESTTK